MGQVLSEPVTAKTSTSGADDRLAYGVSEMQGWRLTMEDAHTHVLDLDATGESSKSQRNSFFAVFDGHGGSTVARYAGNTVHDRLHATEEYKNKSYEQALKRTFLGTDEDLRNLAEFQGDPSGCTAVAILIDEQDRIFCANAGDSRSVMSVDGKATPLSFDHKPGNKGENARIVAAGGYVEFGRVNGNLALSRALGDFEFKKNVSLGAEQQVVTANPDVTIHEPTKEDEFIVVACDGIWDVLSSQDTIDIVRRSIGERKPLEQICEDIMDRCLAPDSDCSGVGCDNMTIMIVALLRGRTLDQWYDHIANKLDQLVGYQTPEYSDLPVPFKNHSAHFNPVADRLGSSSFASVLRGSSVLYNHEHDDDDDDDDEPRITLDEEDDEQALLSNLQAALRREGIRIGPLNDEDDDRFEDMEVDELEGKAKDATKDTAKDAAASDAATTDQLTDKSEDPLKSAAQPTA